MKKFLALLFAFAMTMSLVACGGSNNSTDEANNEDPTSEVGETTDTVQTSKEGVLTMATNAAFPPYEFISDEDATKIVGIDAEIAALIADKLDLTLEIEDMEFASIVTAVQTGKVDIGMAGMTVTEDRLQNVNFSTSYATGVQSIIVPEGSPITSKDSLSEATYKIAVQESTTGHIYAEDEFGAENVEAYSNGALAVEALLAGKADCVIIDNEPAKQYVAANEGLAILDTSYAVEDYAIAISKENEGLLSAVNEALEELIDDGSVQKIIDKYIAA